MSVTLKFFKAGCGDAISIKHTKNETLVEHHLLIDAGFNSTYPNTLKPEIQSIVDSGKQADLYILTHTDRDHINGLFNAIHQFGTSWASNFWFNHSPIEPMYYPPDEEVNVGIRQGIELRNLLQDKGVLANNTVTTDTSISLGDALLTVLSPDKAQYSKWLDLWKEQEREFQAKEASGEQVAAKKLPDYGLPLSTFATANFKEDNSFANRSSIAILYQVGNFTAILTGDAHPSVLCESIRNLGYDEKNPLPVDILKLSHHGSAGSTSDELLRLISCQNYVISTNGMCYNLPNKQTLARILHSPNYSAEQPVGFLFNYDKATLPTIFSTEDEFNYKFATHFATPSLNALIINVDESTLPATITFS